VSVVPRPVCCTADAATSDAASADAASADAAIADADLMAVDEYIVALLAFLAAARSTARVRSTDIAEARAARLVEQAAAGAPIPQVSRLDPATGETLYCLCGTQHETDAIYIGCDGCGDWFHLRCVGLRPLHSRFWILSYACEACRQRHGRRTYVRQEGDRVMGDVWSAVEAAGLPPALRAAYAGGVAAVPGVVPVSPDP
jgi:hypothetical protein